LSQQSALGNQHFVFLLDVDNTLLDNDRVTADLLQYLDETVGPASREEYWNIFDRLRAQLGYADYLGALQMYRLAHPRDPHVLRISSFLINYPFADRLFPRAIDVISRLKQWGQVVILSDGDVVFQPRKVERSGLMTAVDGNVLIYVHKEQELDDVQARYPSDHYVFVDDKLRLLDAFKRAWSSRVTTVFPRQGHYAHDPDILSRYPPADINVERIGDLMSIDFGAI
jgi:FMN phosphatase YigB (HAD superfamily)